MGFLVLKKQLLNLYQIFHAVVTNRYLPFMISSIPCVFQHKQVVCERIIKFFHSFLHSVCFRGTIRKGQTNLSSLCFLSGSRTGCWYIFELAFYGKKAATLYTDYQFNHFAPVSSIAIKRSRIWGIPKYPSPQAHVDTIFRNP